MKVKPCRQGVRVIMTPEELGIIRYTLRTGVEALESTAGFMKALKSEEVETSLETARKAKEASQALETAVQEWLRH